MKSKEIDRPVVPKPTSIPGRPVRTAELKCTCKAAQRVYESAFQMVQEVGSMKAIENANKCFEAAMEAMNNCPAHRIPKGIPCPKCGHALTRLWEPSCSRVVGHYCLVCKEAVQVSQDGEI